MPKKRTSSKDILNVSQALSNAGVSDKTIERIESALDSNKSIDSKMMKEVEKARSKEIKDIRNLNAEIKKLEKNYANLNDVQKKALTIKKEQRDSNERQVESMDRVSESAKKQSVIWEKLKKSVSDSFGSMTTTIANFLNPMNMLNSAVGIVSDLFENWFRLTNLMVGAMGRFSMATGAMGSQLTEFRRSVDTMRDTFSRVVGSVDGIAEAGGFLTDTFVALRMEIDSGFVERFGEQLVFANRNLGLSAEQSAQLFRIIEDGGFGSSRSIEEFGRSMLDFADSIGGNAATLSREFVEARGTIALFGEAGETAFRNAATYANHFGIETSRVLAMAPRFNSFNTAASSVNQLNAVFGTTISSLELMMETDPTRRMSMILDSVRSVASAASITGPQLQALANSLGVDEDVARRMLSGESMEEINRETARRAAEEEEINSRRERAMMTMADMINQTTERLLSWRDMLMQIFNQVSESLSPIFGDFYTVVQNIVSGFRAWLGTILSHPEFRQMMEDIASYIRGLPNNMADFLPSWEEMRDTATTMWPIIRSIGETIMSIIEFAVDHPEAIGIALGVLAISQLVGGFGGLALLLSPGGALLVGIAALGYGIYQAANHAATLTDTVNNIRDIPPELRTESENAMTRNSGRAALVGLMNTSSSNDSMLNDIMNTPGSLGVSALGALGFSETANVLASGRTMGNSGYDDMSDNIRTALGAGVGATAVIDAIMANARTSPDADRMIRRSLGNITGDLRTGVEERVGEMDREINPASYAGESAPEVASAIETAPATAGTVAAAPIASAASVSAGRDTFMAEVLLDGERVGSAIVRRGVRSS